jgi:hypothetical protein
MAKVVRTVKRVILEVIFVPFLGHFKNDVVLKSLLVGSSITGSMMILKGTLLLEGRKNDTRAIYRITHC